MTLQRADPSKWEGALKEYAGNRIFWSWATPVMPDLIVYRINFG